MENSENGCPPRPRTRLNTNTSDSELKAPRYPQGDDRSRLWDYRTSEIRQNEPKECAIVDIGLFIRNRWLENNKEDAQQEKITPNLIHELASA